MVESYVGTDITSSDEIGEDSNHLDKGADLTMVDEAMNEGAVAAWMFSFMGKKLWKRKKPEGKISLSSSRMMRTISIHHLECTDFVSQSEASPAASSSESSKNVVSSDSLALSECESQVLQATHESAKEQTGEEHRFIDAENNLLDKHIVLKDRLVEARDALLMLNDVDTKGNSNEFAKKSKLFLDTVELFNEDREAIVDAPEDPYRVAPDDAGRLQAPIKARMLTKSASFPGSQFSGSAGGTFLPSYRRMKSVSIDTQGTKSESVRSFSDIVRIGSGTEVLPGSHELRRRREAGTVLNRLRCLKERIKDVIKENRKEKKRISRDGILHKVPFGRNLLDDSSSEGCGSYSKFARKSFRRSVSLDESLDRYSHLLKTLSLNEKGEDTESSKSIRKDNGLLQDKLPRSLGRMLSSPAFRSYSLSKAVQLEPSKILVADPSGSKMETIVRSKSIREDNGPVFRSYSFSKSAQSEHFLKSSQILTPESLGIVMETNGDKPINEALISPILEKNECEHEEAVDPDSPFSTEEAIRSDKFVTSTVESITEVIESLNQVCVDDSESMEPSLCTEVMEKEGNFNRHDQIEAESDVKTEKPSFIFSLDLNMVEDSDSSAKGLLREDSEQQPEQPQLSDTHPTEQTKTSFPTHTNNRSDDTLFDSVRYKLTNSDHRTLLSSPQSPLYQQKLLHDLINETLLGIQEHSTAPNPWLLSFHSKSRGMPVGKYLVEEIWTEVRWRLCAPQGLDATLDDLKAYDFAKNEGWMNLYREAECVALQVEFLVLDGLLEEAVAGSCGFDL